jgi:transcription termination factor Rho
MSVITRSALEASPLADLHTIASELGLDGYRRLRKADLVDRIIVQQGGEEAVAATATNGDGSDEVTEAPKRRSRGGRSSRSRRKDADEDVVVVADEVVEAEEVAETEEAAETEVDFVIEPVGDSDVETEAEAQERPKRRSRGGRGGRDRDRGGDREGGGDRERGGDRNGGRDRDRGERADRDRGERDSDAPEREDRIIEGTVELLPNGSGFVRLTPPEPSDDDVYVSAAQVRRCELVSGDKVGGPVREPRRSERYPSLIRIDTINGRPADEVAEGTHFDDLPCTLPTERLALGSEDATLKAIEWLTPIGKGSRVAIVGEAHAGKSEALKRLAGALKSIEGLEVHVVLAAVRPEECAEWRASDIEPVASLSLSASADAAGQAVERAVDTAKRITARGGDVVVLIDGLDSIAPHAARRALAAARNVVDGGSLTIVATATAPVGGETTIIALDRTLTRTGRFPALDLVASGTLRPELLVGDAGADAIAQARAQALG